MESGSGHGCVANVDPDPGEPKFNTDPSGTGTSSVTSILISPHLHDDLLPVLQQVLLLMETDPAIWIRIRIKALPLH